MATVYGQYAAYGFGPTTSDDWRDDASCREVDPELFFPVGVGTEFQVAQAVRVCNGCSVKSECLAWALENGIADGIWGGATEFQRRRIKRLSAKAGSDA